MKDEKKLMVRAMEDDHGDRFIEITLSEKILWRGKIRLTDREASELVTEILECLNIFTRDKR